MPRILVADDNTNIQKMVCLAFQERGVEVTSVGNGEAAVRRLPDLNPDLILADIFMPVRNGYELCEWVKKDSKFSHIPVILLVGAFDPLDEKEARRVGADGVLKKPFIPPDPLIAMVTSTLEKNPKLAAEMAAAKATPAPLPPAAAVEVAPKIEVKPLPEFPEPAEEEASLAYGFGVGRRGVDDADGEESAAARAPKSEADEAEEEFDGSSTTNDWRRTAMEFEVPEEAAHRPAFSTEEEIEAPPTSEQEITPDQIGSEQALHEMEAVLEQDAAVQISEPPQEQQQHLTEAPSVSPDAQPVSEFSPAPIEAEGDHVPAIAAGGIEQPAPSSEKDSESKPIGAPEASFASKASHWMDLMASTLGQAKGDWLSSISAQAPAPPEPREQEAKASQGGSVPEAEQAQVHQEHDPQDQQRHPHVSVTAPVAQQIAPPPSAEQEDWFFADEAPANEAPTSQVPEGSVASSRERTERASAPASEPRGWQGDLSATRDFEPPAEFESTVAEDVPLPAMEADSKLLVEKASDERSWSVDPALIQPPAVRVTPEPLLVDESPKGPLGYEIHEQDVAPTYALLPEAQQSSAVAPPSSDENLAEGSVGQHLSASPSGLDSPLEFPSSELDERIPTTFPPNREALADIPFLNPPRDFQETEEEEEESETASSSLSDERLAVEALAQKILERIEPQLRDLLSENLLKPLIENLVQSELQKKGR